MVEIRCSRCRVLLIFTSLVLVVEIANTQSYPIDSSKSNMWPSIGLMASGVILNQPSIKQDLQNEIHDLLGRTESNIDDYLAFAPTIQFIGHNLIHTNNQKYHFSQYLISTASSLAITYSLKYALGQKRPSGGSLSFPSGHTSFAFSTAAVNYQMLKESHPFWAWMSYLPAATTGVMRITRNKHWPSDVLFGAGLGILCTQLTYRFRPLPITNRQNTVVSNIHFGMSPLGISVSMDL